VNITQEGDDDQDVEIELYKHIDEKNVMMEIIPMEMDVHLLVKLM
jgi:hypothetical protein